MTKFATKQEMIDFTL